jgi:ABC-type enterochelin transport system ATPase subunit
MIEIKNVSKSYVKNKKVINNVSFKLSDGKYLNQLLMFIYINQRIYFQKYINLGGFNEKC